MGQKVSPIGMRVGVIRDWESRWYADKAEFGDLLNEDIKIREYLEKNLKDAYISRVEIERAGKKNVKVIIRCARPGAIVGKTEDGKAEKMDATKKALAKIAGGKSVKVEVVAVANPDLDARLVARKICEALENRQSFRITQKKAIQQTMRSGAKGMPAVHLAGWENCYSLGKSGHWLCPAGTFFRTTGDRLPSIRFKGLGASRHRRSLASERHRLFGRTALSPL